MIRFLTKSNSLQMTEPQSFERRQILSAGGLAMGALFMPKAVFSAAPAIINPSRFEKSLTLLNTHTHETFKGAFWANGEFIQEQLKAINYNLRDHRTGAVKDINPKLINLLHRLQEKLNRKKPYEVICGYRSEATNEKLRNRSKGVAKNSKHMYGDAIDVRVPGTSLTQFVRAARSEKAGGVGGYRRDNFVHVDVRATPHYWGQV